MLREFLDAAVQRFERALQVDGVGDEVGLTVSPSTALCAPRSFRTRTLSTSDQISAIKAAPAAASATIPGASLKSDTPRR